MIASSFTKLFSSITDSSIWSEDSDTKVVWVTMLAMADQFGRVSAAIPGLAKRSGVNIEATQKALEKFLSPDPHSRTKDHEGRRIEVIEGGWRLLNHEIYKEIRHEEDRKEQNRLAQQRRREKLKSQQIVSNSQQNQPRSAHIDADTDVYTNNKKAPSSKEDENGLPGADLALQGYRPPVKTVPPSRHALLKLWNSEYAEAHGGEVYHHTRKDDYPMDELLSKFTPEKIMECARNGWKSKVDFIRNTSSTFDGLNQNWNKIINDSKSHSKTPIKDSGIFAQKEVK